MLDDVSFAPSDVTLNNLSRITQDGLTVTERRVCEIFELVNDAVRFSLGLNEAGIGMYEILSLISDGLSS